MRGRLLTTPTAWLSAPEANRCCRWTQTWTRELHEQGFYIAVETNGTQIPPEGIDWLCVSPKKGSELVVESGDELKLVYPQDNDSPADYEHLNFKNFRLQPMDSDSAVANTASAVEYCLEHPKWQLSLQTHKYLGIP